MPAVAKDATKDMVVDNKLSEATVPLTKASGLFDQYHLCFS